MKNVLIIANNGMGNSGVPSVICQVIKSQCEECKFTLLVFNDDDFYYPFLKEHNVEIIRLDLKTPESQLKKFIFYFFSFPRRLQKETSKLIKQKNIDIIHSFKEEEGWPSLKAGKKLKVNIRIAHCNNEFRNRSGFFAQILAKRNQKKLLKYSSTNVGACEKCCDLMFKKKQYSVIYNSYNESRFNNNVSNKLKTELVLTQIATFSSRKNQLFSIDLVEKLINDGNQCKLNLIGFSVEDGYLDKMQAKIREKKLENNVRVINGQNGINDIFEKTTFLLLPSISEGAPIVLVDAQACGIRCFATDSITEEMNCGGITFLPISDGLDLWENSIKSTFSEVGNKRVHYDMTRFSSETFKTEISKVYKL